MNQRLIDFTYLLNILENNLEQNYNRKQPVFMCIIKVNRQITS